VSTPGMRPFRASALLLFLAVPAPGIPARDLPPPPEAPFPLAVRPGGAGGAWKPMKGSPPVKVLRAGGTPVFRMDCPFDERPLERASWDHSFRVDLARAGGVGLLLYVEDLSPVSHFTFFLKSGKGWYAFTVKVPGAKRWFVLELRKETSRIEGAPGGFRRVEALRFSAWRGGEKRTGIYLGGVGILPPRGRTAVVRMEGRKSLSPAAGKYVRRLCLEAVKLLSRFGLESSLLSDLDLRDGVPAGVELLVLPRNPALPPGTAGPVESFLGKGGKVLSFLVLPGFLRKEAGLARGPGSGGGPISGVLRPDPKVFTGLPREIPFSSARAGRLEPSEKKARVLATWTASGGKSRPAVILSGGVLHLDLLPAFPDREGSPLLDFFFLDLLEKVLPGTWKRAAVLALDRMGRFGPWKDWKAARKALGAAARERGVSLRELDLVDRLRKESVALLAKGDYRGVLERAFRAEGLVKTAFCRVQPSRRGEFRGFWCHSAFGVEGMTWEETARSLAGNGFTAVFPNMLWGSGAYYESEVLPPAPGVKERGDQLALCVKACHAAGIQVHVWKVNWNTGNRCPSFIERLRREGRLQEDSRGREKSPPWLCPSDPRNRRLEADAMLEVARKYPVDGIHFDYIRYPGPDACFCPRCRRLFEKRLGRRVSPWPGAVLAGGALRRAWLRFRRENITALVRDVSERVKSLPRKVMVSAAVFRNWPVDRDRIGQDWVLWCRKGWLDFVCPMDYTPDTREFSRFVAAQVDWAGKVPLYPGIGYSVWKDTEGVYTLAAEVKAARRLGAKGFLVFNLGPREAREILPLLGLGLTRER